MTVNFYFFFEHTQSRAHTKRSTLTRFIVASQYQVHSSEGKKLGFVFKDFFV